MRIVSLLPSATEMVCALGLEAQLVGVSHECDYPPAVLGLPKVTGTFIPSTASSAEIDRLVRERMHGKRALYSLDVERLRALAPDLIVTQALCDVCAVAEEDVRAAACRLPGTPRIINLEPRTLQDLMSALRTVGRAADVEARAEEVIAALTARVGAVEARSADIKMRPRVAFLEWLNPLFSSGHWNPQMVRLAGGREGFGLAGQPARSLEWHEVAGWKPEAIFIACCGFGVERTLQDLPALAAQPGWQDLPAVRSAQVYVVDGSHYFSRPGPRLIDSLEILAHALHADIHPLPAGFRAARRIDEQTLRAAC